MCVKKRRLGSFIRLSVPLAALTLCLFLSLQSGCSFTEEKTAPQLSASGSVGSGTGFDQIKTQVLTPSCLQCHATKAPLMTSYATIQPALDSIRQAVFVNRSMPKNGALTTAQSALLLSWLNSGGPEFPNSPPAPIAPPAAQGPISWRSLKKKVIDVSCASCHFAKNTQGISDYTDLATFRASIDTIVFTTLLISEAPMPPLPATLTPSQRRLLADWIADGERDQDGVAVTPAPTSSPSPLPSGSPTNPPDDGNIDGHETEFHISSPTPGNTGIDFSIGYFAGTHHGMAKEVESSVVMTLGRSLDIRSAKLSVPIASMETGNATRDCHLREALGIDYSHSKFPAEHVCNSDNEVPASGPDSVAFPTIDLELESWTSANHQKDLNPGESIDLVLKMKVTIHGVAHKNVQIPIHAVYSETVRGAVHMTGSFPVVLLDYGIVVKPVLGSFGNVSDKAKVSLDFTLLP